MPTTEHSQPTLFAERVLKTESGQEVRVRLFAPTKSADDPNGDWECRYQMEGASIDVSSQSFGVDSLQALTSALAGISRQLEPHRASLSWHSLGDHGIPLIVPYHDADFRTLLVHAIEAENIRYVIARKPPASKSRR